MVCEAPRMVPSVRPAFGKVSLPLTSTSPGFAKNFSEQGRELRFHCFAFETRGRDFVQTVQFVDDEAMDFRDLR
ncbi:hypothetical protein CEY04_05230 [Achromobacter sp. HZ28]|nr:hypothetical protein CEY05_05240 [Achromobacter sp. HZ34]OWT81294.1 hypothetical protein CEY04_05230 [Achromobacter sp. HZ28]